jgi:hypothetical protein
MLGVDNSSNMGHPRRYFEHLRPYFVTNRLAQGLPLVPNKFINGVLKGILARAQSMAPSVAICDFAFLANHYHAVIVPQGSPQDVVTFFNFVDGEIAKAVKQLLSIPYNVKLWSQRYHAAGLLDPEAVIKQLVYLWANPVAADFVDRADKWFGVGFFTPTLHNRTIHCKYVPSSLLPALPNTDLTPELIHRLCIDYAKSDGVEHELHITPLAWIEFFNTYCGMKLTPELVTKQLLLALEAAEEKERTRRTFEGKALAARSALEQQNPHKKYIPTKLGRRVFCISTIPELRLEFIKLYQDFCRTCERVWQCWKEGNFQEQYPPGAFTPSRGLFANILPAPL